jgi:hypothetical protein
VAGSLGHANLFSDPRYMNGAATNPDFRVVTHAAAQVKAAIDATIELGGLGYVFWGGREGYSCLLNTDMKRELENLGRFLAMARDYGRKSGFTGVFYIEPKPMEPSKHQYDFEPRRSSGSFAPGPTRLQATSRPATRRWPGTRSHELQRHRRRPARQHRRQPRRSAERLGHRPVPDGSLPDDEAMMIVLQAEASGASTSTRRSGARRRSDDLFRPHRRHGCVRAA